MAPVLTWRHVPIALLAMLGTARALAGVAAILHPFLRIDYDLRFELAMVTGQVLVQWLVLWSHTWRERADYAAVLVVVSFVGAVLLAPLLVWNHLAPVPPLVGLAYFFAVVALIFALHVTLVVRRGFPKLLCATWVLYRLAILLYAARL